MSGKSKTESTVQDKERKIRDELKELSLKFIEQVKQKVNLARFDRDEWFKGCYSTIQRTIRGGLAERKKERLKNLLFDSIDSLRQTRTCKAGYDEWFENLVSSIRTNINLTFGQAQKIVNILMKYHFCYYWADFDRKWNNSYCWLFPFFEFFHVPIDNVVLFNLKRKYGGEDEKINRNIKVWEYKNIKNAVFCLTRDTQRRQVRWSRMGGKQEIMFYYYIQDFIDRMISKSGKYANRLHFEMKELWTAN